ncbi:unnamed protein product [Zymoseptoria tritici ST99CH_1A5]|uniref:Uncharacterized protein n=3 Tax=Zymoseptoria tritici TaxID=1047171 RepID=A0A1X7RXQ1_ZYMT9|nr:unnamed protein product [Zymoseptoria tritici ST99CH_3D7]SMR54001.1 unnamed protein product [Zymoseptoria tritici ST99CH_1E4]SMR56185.1 unnamed protein product [Zymoseptoria tritici ST99CH_3D1]SMY25368.1 unnamed protein product [Zymoseptoria tritici ST99CH_1A5]
MGVIAMESHDLEKRQVRCTYTAFGGRRCYGNRYSTWNSWARWLVLGLVVGAAILFFLVFSCISARRRRKAGSQPFRGTGWALGKTPNRNDNTAQPYYGNNMQNMQTTQPYYNNSNNPAPPPTYGGANNSYYGKDNTGVQAPAPAYGGYAPPQGPPPGGRNY